MAKLDRETTNDYFSCFAYASRDTTLPTGIIRASLWGLIVAIYLRFGLEPTGWAFYEASHATGVDGLYWGYTVFRGGGYAFSLWQYQTLACVLAGAVVALFIHFRNQRRSRS